MPKTAKRKIGDFGEDIAEMFLVKRGFKILERNHLRKWGEIDIIAKKSRRLYFIEVKTVSCVTYPRVPHETPSTIKTIFRNIFCEIFLMGARGFTITDVSCGTKTSPKTVGFLAQPQRAERAVSQIDRFRPEDNLHPHKLQRLRRTIQTYLAEKGISEESDWQFDAICVYLDEKRKYAEVECIKDIIL